MSPHRVLQQVHQGLGTVDAEDQIAALEYVHFFLQPRESYFVSGQIYIHEDRDRVLKVEMSFFQIVWWTWKVSSS